MKRTFDKTQSGAICMLCAKTAVMGMHKPNSQKRTKRTLKPNLQSYFGLTVCTRCLRTLKSKQAESSAVMATQSSSIVSE